MTPMAMTAVTGNPDSPGHCFDARDHVGHDLQSVLGGAECLRGPIEPQQRQVLGHVAEVE